MHAWNPDLPVAGYIGCNPSTAGGSDRAWWDPTARKFDGFAQRLGFGGWIAGNLFGLVSTLPGALSHHPDPVGEGNDAAIRTVAVACDRIIVCWGTPGGAFAERVAAVLDLLAPRPLWCLGTTVGGHPRHPSRLGYDASLVPFMASEAKD